MNKGGCFWARGFWEEEVDAFFFGGGRGCEKVGDEGGRYGPPPARLWMMECSRRAEPKAFQCLPPARSLLSVSRRPHATVEAAVVEITEISPGRPRLQNALLYLPLRWGSVAPYLPEPILRRLRWKARSLQLGRSHQFIGSTVVFGMHHQGCLYFDQRSGVYAHVVKILRRLVGTARAAGF
eukprot:scaffold193_cov255-Pinguiococcus_pyrenoidosus.AAC.2